MDTKTHYVAGRRRDEDIDKKKNGLSVIKPAARHILRGAQRGHHACGAEGCVIEVADPCK